MNFYFAIILIAANPNEQLIKILNEKFDTKESCEITAQIIFPTEKYECVKISVNSLEEK